MRGTQVHYEATGGQTRNTCNAFYTLLVAFLMVGCNPEGSENDKNPEKTYRIVEIEGCEYIFISTRPWGSDMAITHKGNCTNH